HPADLRGLVGEPEAESTRHYGRRQPGSEAGIGGVGKPAKEASDRQHYGRDLGPHTNATEVGRTLRLRRTAACSTLRGGVGGPKAVSEVRPALRASPPGPPGPGAASGPPSPRAPFLRPREC